MAQKYRHEIKYFISQSEYLSIKNRVRQFMSIDKYASNGGAYHIRSLYFDSYNNKALFEKIAGVNEREKFRIRFYNFDTKFMRLEKKSKNNGYTLKKSCKIDTEQCKDILENNFKENEQDDALLKEFYKKIKEEHLRPMTIVDYKREAFIYSIGNVRVTFDTDIKTALFNTNVLDKNIPTIKANHNENIIIMEVKFDEFLPSVIRDLIQTNHQKSIAVSKYVLCRNYY